MARSDCVCVEGVCVGVGMCVWWGGGEGAAF